MVVVVPVVDVGAVVVAGVEVDVEEPELLPHAASAMLAASTAAIVSMAVSGVLFMGRTSVPAREPGRTT